MSKIVSTAGLTDTQKSSLEAAAPSFAVADHRCRTLEEIEALIDSRTEILFTFRIPEDAIERAPRLKWVQILSAGIDHVPQALEAAGVRVTTASGIHATAIGEYTIASMLMWAHRMHVTSRAQMRREWLASGFMGRVDVLRGKTLGLIGYGSIGRETARLAAAFGMRLLALKREPSTKVDPGWAPAGLGDPEGTLPEAFYGPEQRVEMIRRCDYLAISLPLTAHTRRFIGREELAACKPSTFLVNVGRGQLIDQPALVDALSAGRVGGVGLDVFEHEPLESESPLWGLEEAILTPHMSGAARGYMDRACELFVENLRRYVSARPLLNLVNRELGY